MAGECAKYGAVEHVYVDKASRGFVYLVSQPPPPPLLLPALLVRVLGARAGVAPGLTSTCWSSLCCCSLAWAPPCLSSPVTALQKFNSVPAAANAQRALHGRWFAARQIAADFQVGAVWECDQLPCTGVVCALHRPHGWPLHPAHPAVLASPCASPYGLAPLLQFTPIYNQHFGL